MEQINEIHIAPLGYERDRIVEPIRKHNADVVYLLEDTIHGGRTGYHEEMIETLRDDGMAVHVETADLQDLYDVMEFADDAELRFIAEANPANDKAKFALLNANIIDPLQEDGYIEVNPVGRQKQIELTETGENVLHAFRHKLSR